MTPPKRLGPPTTFHEAYWRTVDGRKIKIQDIENNHLINILRRIKRLASKKAGEKVWRKHVTNCAPHILTLLEKEVTGRGLTWDPDEVRNRSNSEAASEVCISCPLSLICKTRIILSLVCRDCRRSFVPMGAASGNVYVSDACPRYQRFRKWAVCHECKKKST